MENRVLLIGDVVRLGEAKTLPSGARVFDFTLRTWGRTQDGQVIFQYHPINVWGTDQEKFSKNLVLGKFLRIDGMLVHNTWEDKFGHRYTVSNVRALLIKESAIDIPPIPESERSKFEEKQKELSFGNSPKG